MTNEDVIDLYNRAKVGAIVVVLAPHHGDTFAGSSQMAQGGNTNFGSWQ